MMRNCEDVRSDGETFKNSVTFEIINLGCKVNRVESDDAARFLSSLNCIHTKLENADIIVVNTCTVTAEADKKTRKTVRHCLAANSFGRVIVTGCAAAMSPETFTEMDKRVDVVAKIDLEDRLKRVVEDIVCNKPASSDENANAVFAGRSRIGLKIQDGCDNACTYCIVCIARGSARSVSVDKILDRACDIANSGIQEIVLSGIDLGAYSWNGLSLEVLLQRLLLATKDCLEGFIYPVRFRISSIEPTSIDDALLNLIASSQERICRHLHIPLQSGSDKVLSEMGRRYTRNQYLKLIEHIKDIMPDMAITTDVIAGFPGETQSDFEETLDLCRRCGFSSMHVFPYSQRLGTVAASRDDQVDHKIKQERARILRSLSHELRRNDAQSRIGSRELFLVQEDGVMMSGSYYGFPASDDAPVGHLCSHIFDRMPL